MNLMELKNVLVLAPHPDDGELGCGGFIHKLSLGGAKVHCAVFSPCKKSVPEGFDQDVLYREFDNAVDKLGVSISNIKKFNFPVRNFPNYRQEILEELVKLNKTIHPDLVLVPNTTDIHQDHYTIQSEALRAFKRTNILGYEMIWNNRHATTNYFVKLSEENVQAKLNALEEYKSQNFRDYFDKGFVKHLAQVRGVQIGADLAEAYEWITGGC